MKKIKKLLKNQGFTLVELIIVIAIIAVLAVAAFMMLTKWLSKSRDSGRLSDLGTIERGLQVGYSDVDDGINMYPTVKNQTGAIGIMSGDEVVGYQGVVNIDVANAASMQKAPLDPSDNNEYTYLVSQNRQKFQLLAMLEDGTEVSVANNVFALDYSNRFPRTKGFNLGVIIQESTNLPLQYIGLTETGVDITLGNGYVAVVKDDDIRSGTGVVTAPIIKEETIIIPENSEESSCTTQPSYSHASFVAGNPTAPSTDWQQDSSSNPCYYKCIDGYSGVDCTTPPPGSDVLLIHSNTTNGSTTFTDSALNKTISPVGNIKHTTETDIKFGTSVISFDGNGDYLSLPDSTDWNFGTEDFTIDFWMNVPESSSPATIITQFQDGSNYWYVHHSNGVNLLFHWISGGVVKGTYTAPFDPTPGQWYHIAFERNGITGRLFINGVEQTLGENVAFGTNDLGDANIGLTIGSLRGLGEHFNGYIDEIRIRKGGAVRTENFTPSTSPY